jgi:TNF receptor-associated factor 4
MARHYETSTAAHVKLLLRASAEIREVSETMAKDVEKVVRDEEGLNESDRVERDAVLRALRAEEERMLQDMKTLRENEADARKRGELYAQALEKALEDQAETYDAAIAEVREEILAVRGEFETYKSQASFELNELRQAMSSAQIALSEVSARAATITRDGGILDEHKLAIEEEIKHDREHALGELEKATRQIRFEIEDASAEHARKILSLRDDIRMVLNSRIR